MMNEEGKVPSKENMTIPQKSENQPGEAKVCTQCEELKPVSAFRLQPCRGQLMSACKACEALYRASKKDPEKAVEWATRRNQTKLSHKRTHCSECGTAVGPEYFNLSRHSRCADCKSRRDRASNSTPERRAKEVARQRAKDSTPEGRKKKRARCAASYRVRSGKLMKQPCAVCLSPRAEKHHPDYGKPLDVIWLCRKHHAQAHRLARLSA